MRFDGNVTARCANVGEAEGALAMFSRDAEVLGASVAQRCAQLEKMDRREKKKGGCVQEGGKERGGKALARTDAACGWVGGVHGCSA